MDAREKDIRERVKKATPGQWSWDLDSDLDCCTVNDADFMIAVIQPYESEGGQEQREANAAFIAHSREDIPYLLRVIDRLRGRIEEVELDLQLEIDGRLDPRD